jgi:hypothetical protein
MIVELGLPLALGLVLGQSSARRLVSVDESVLAMDRVARGPDESLLDLLHILAKECGFSQISLRHLVPPKALDLAAAVAQAIVTTVVPLLIPPLLLS